MTEAQLAADFLRNHPGMLRIEHDDDMVRFEIATALNCRKPVIPILFDISELPPGASRPPLDQLAKLNHFKVNSGSIHEALPSLVKALRAHLR